MKTITEVINIYKNSFDPTNEHLINSLKMTVPMILGAVYLLCSRRPCTWMVFLPPGFIILATFGCRNIKNKLLVIFLGILNLEIAQLAVTLLSNHKAVLVIFLFFQLMIIYSSLKYRQITATSGWLIAVTLTFSNSWYNGVDRSIDLLVAFILSSLTVIVFDYLFSKLIIRSSLKHISTLVSDAFFICTENDKTKIKNSINNKYLFENNYLRKADLFVEKTFESKQDIFIHKITTGLNKAEKITMHEKYFFGKNIIYAFYAGKIFHQYKKLFRSINFILNYKNSHLFFAENIPYTDKIIKYINKELIEISNLINNGTYDPVNTPEKDIIFWKQQIHLYRQKNLDVNNYENEKCLFGLNQIVNELSKLKNMCKNKILPKLY
ncbi:MAG: hypothetical protein GY756_12505 [bacterium]|nr:hypothetical protein [bacterium]